MNLRSVQSTARINLRQKQGKKNEKSRERLKQWDRSFDRRITQARDRSADRSGSGALLLEPLALRIKGDDFRSPLPAGRYLGNR
jgi:hypothetical protein